MAVEFKYIRKRNLLYERIGDENKFHFVQEFSSISAAKRHTNELERSNPGIVRRWETLGERSVRDMCNVSEKAHG
jgi:hypothetical protein